MQNPQLHTMPNRRRNQRQNQAATPPPPPTQPDADDATAQPAAGRNIPDIIGPRGGWYPRWWIISAFFSSIVITIVILLWNTALCRPHGTTLPFICNYTNWPSVGQIPLIWVLFLVLWYPIFSIGMKQVEIPGTKRSRFGNIVRSFSQFGPVDSLILLQGCIALSLIIVMWWLDLSTPLSFAFLCILVFLANCSFFQRLFTEDRITFIRIYGLTALVGIIIDIFFKPNFWSHVSSNSELPLFCVQIILLIVGVITFFWRPRPDAQLTAQQQRNRNINRLTGPFALLGTLWPFRYIFPPRPVGTGPQGNPGNPDPDDL